jgi:hypothetical protein
MNGKRDDFPPTDILVYHRNIYGGEVDAIVQATVGASNAAPRLNDSELTWHTVQNAVGR